MMVNLNCGMLRSFKECSVFVYSRITPSSLHCKSNMVGQGGLNMSRGIRRGKYEQEKYILYCFANVISYCFSPAPPPTFQTVNINQGLCNISPEKNKGNRA